MTKQIKLKKGFTIAHIIPRAYCVAKPAIACATFATPYFDHNGKKFDQFKTAHHVYFFNKHKNALLQEDINVGTWATLAYISSSSSGEWIAFKPIKIQC